MSTQITAEEIYNISNNLSNEDRLDVNKLLLKIFGNILLSPNEQKYKDINYNKTVEKFSTAKCAKYGIYVLLQCGFQKYINDKTEERMKFNMNNLSLLKQVNNLLLMLTPNKQRNEDSDLKDTKNHKTQVVEKIKVTLNKISNVYGTNLIIRYGNNEQIIFCAANNQPIQSEMINNNVISMLMKMNYYKSYSDIKQFRWLDDNEPLCPSTQLQYIADKKYLLEEQMKLFFNNEEMYRFPTESFKDIATIHCNHIPSDVVITFKGARFSIFSTPNSIGLKQNDAILLSHRKLKSEPISTIYCQELGQFKVAFEVQLSEYTVWDLKHMINKKHGLSLQQFRLVFNRLQLSDHQILSHIGVKSECVIAIILRLRGS